MFDTKITVDDEIFYEGPASCVLVGNTGSLKGGVEAFPDASSTDGRLHIAAVTATGMREWANLMMTAVLRKQQWSGHSEIGEGTSITVKFDGKRRYELDGGVKGKAKKLEFEIKPALTRGLRTVRLNPSLSPVDAEGTEPSSLHTRLRAGTQVLSSRAPRGGSGWILVDRGTGRGLTREVRADDQPGTGTRKGGGGATCCRRSEPTSRLDPGHDTVLVCERVQCLRSPR